MGCLSISLLQLDQSRCATICLACVSNANHGNLVAMKQSMQRVRTMVMLQNTPQTSLHSFGNSIRKKTTSIICGNIYVGQQTRLLACVKVFSYVRKRIVFVCAFAPTDFLGFFSNRCEEFPLYIFSVCCPSVTTAFHYLFCNIYI